MAFSHAVVLATGQVTSGAAFEDVLVREVLPCDDSFPIKLPRQLVDGDQSGTSYVALDGFVANLAFSEQRARSAEVLEELASLSVLLRSVGPFVAPVASLLFVLLQ